MPYFPIAPGTDDRKKRAVTPITLRNCMLERAPQGAATRSPFVIIPTPGRRLLATLPENVRGLFAEPGVQGGDLFVPAGSTFYHIAPETFVTTPIGALGGGEPVTVRGMRANLMIRAAGTLTYYDGAAFTHVTDPNAPLVASTLAIVGNRVVAADDATDGFDWSKAGLPLEWDQDGVANDIDLPDPIVGQEEIGGDLWSFNSRSTQVWQATGSTEDEAFAPVAGAVIRKGLMGRAAIAPVGQSGRMLLGDDRVLYATSGLGLTPIPNRDFEDALLAFTEDELADTICWSYKDGSKEYFITRVTGMERAVVMDVAEGTFHERTKFGANQYDLGFAARAYGLTIVASPGARQIWALDPDVFDDDGTPIERVMTLHVPVGADTAVNRLVFDMRVRDQPLSGQGAAPQMFLNWSADGGESLALQSGNLREVNLPAAGVTGQRIQAFSFGLARSESGWLLYIHITDPIRFALAGVWVNPKPEEIP